MGVPINLVEPADQSQAARPSLYSWQVGILGFWRFRVELSSASRYISTVTCDFQTAPQVVLVISVLFGH